ncbi:MAG: hypothetical protein ACTSPB_21765 [Candidatus Thorarchaeota archaeon]
MRPKVYYAIPIRGAKGKEATVEDMATNCSRAKRNLEILKLVYPEIEWVSVAPYDLVVQRLLAYKYVNINSILAVDFEIGDECQGLLCHLWDSSEGAMAEYNRQVGRGKICCLVKEDGVYQIWRSLQWEKIDKFVGEVINEWKPKGKFIVFTEGEGV